MIIIIITLNLINRKQLQMFYKITYLETLLVVTTISKILALCSYYKLLIC